MENLGLGGARWARAKGKRRRSALRQRRGKRIIRACMPKTMRPSWGLRCADVKQLACGGRIERDLGTQSIETGEFLLAAQEHLQGHRNILAVEIGVEIEQMRFQPHFGASIHRR